MLREATRITIGESRRGTIRLRRMLGLGAPALWELWQRIQILVNEAEEARRQRLSTERVGWLIPRHFFKSANRQSNGWRRISLPISFILKVV